MYAVGTSVSVERSRAEIERLIRKHGARKVGIYTDDSQAVVTFSTADRTVKFSIPMQSAEEVPPEVLAAAKKRHRSADEARRLAVDAEERRRWRCLLLVIKAKLESVADAVETFDEAFLAHIVTPGGRTILEELRTIEKSSGQRLLNAAQ
jgi:hypothetical protein